MCAISWVDTNAVNALPASESLVLNAYNLTANVKYGACSAGLSIPQPELATAEGTDIHRIKHASRLSTVSHAGTPLLPGSNLGECQ